MASNVSVVIKSVGAKETASDIKSIGDAADKAGDSAEHSGAKLASAFGGIAKLAIGASVGLGALGGIVGAVGFRFDNMKEQATIAFTTMLGDGTKAKAFLDDLQDFAAKTPFEFPELIQASQKLLAMGFAAKDVRPMLTAVGDAVAGLGGGSEMIDRVTTALGQMHAKGKTSSEEMMQLTEAGIPAWQMLADAIGTSVPEAMDKVQHGAIDADTTIAAVTKGMETRFGGMMDKQSHTFGGLLSTIKDTFTQVSGQVMAPFFDMATRGLQKIVDLTSTKGFQNGVQAFADGLASAASAAADFIASGIEKIGPTLVDIASLTFDGLMELYRLEWEGMQKAWEVIGPILTDAANLAWDKLLDLANASWDKLQALGPTFDSLKTSMAGIDMASFASGWERVKSAIQPAIDVLKPLAEQLLASLKNQFQEVGKALGPLGSALTDLAAAFKPLEPLIKPIAEVLGVVIVAAIAALLVQLRLFTEFLTITLVAAIKAATLAIEGIAAVYEKVNSLLAPYVAKFISIGTDIIGGLLEGAISGGKALWEWLKDVGPAVLRFVGDTSRVLWDAGRNLVEGLFGGILDKFASGFGAIKDKLDPRNWDIPGLSPLPEAMLHAGQIAGGKFVGGLHGSLVQGIESVVTSARAALSGMANVAGAPAASAKSGIKNLGGNFPEIVQDITGRSVQQGGALDWQALLAANIYTGAAAEVAGVRNPQQGVYYQVPPSGGTPVQNIHVTLNIDGQAVASAVARAADLAMS